MREPILLSNLIILEFSRIKKDLMMPFGHCSVIPIITVEV